LSWGADQARVAMAVRGTPEQVFTAFTQEINLWWQRGPRFRSSPGEQGLICMESGIGGRVFESWIAEGKETVIEIGRITHWHPPHGLGFTWRNANFAPSEQTLVDVAFTANGTNTLVTVTHKGWSAVRANHPARHGQESRAFLAGLGGWWANLLRGLDRRMRKGDGHP
jgi:uncharacterized protein YndB with AHSA1/START domain